MTKTRVILLVLAVAAIAACAKMMAKPCRESEWRGLTESEARAKLDAMLPGKIPADKRSEISDKIVAKMSERGVVTDDPVVPDDASSLTDDLANH